VTIAEVGGITTILSKMKTHSFTAGGKATIMSAMENHASNVNVQEKGNGALRILTKHGK
jgi:hypothetical protein